VRNVVRVIHRLGSEVTAVYPHGGVPADPSATASIHIAKSHLRVAAPTEVKELATLVMDGLPSGGRSRMSAGGTRLWFGYKSPRRGKQHLPIEVERAFPCSRVTKHWGALAAKLAKQDGPHVLRHKDGRSSISSC
jgi:hypothetical protein